jgi:hypothetical protein
MWEGVDMLLHRPLGERLTKPLRLGFAEPGAQLQQLSDLCRQSQLLKPFFVLLSRADHDATEQPPVDARPEVS